MHRLRLQPCRCGQELQRSDPFFIGCGDVSKRACAACQVAQGRREACQLRMAQTECAQQGVAQRRATLLDHDQPRQTPRATWLGLGIGLGLGLVLV